MKYSVIIALLSLALSGGRAATQPERLTVQLVKADRVVLGEKSATLEELVTSQASSELSVSKSGGWWVFQSKDKPVEITIEGAPDCTAVVPVRHTLKFKTDWDRSIFDYATPEQNTNEILFGFSDGGHVAMRGSSTGRLDYLKDNSYYFWGRGQLSGTNSDGVKIAFGPVFPPMMGGPLKSQVGTNGVAKMGRVLPTIPVIMNSADGEEVTIRVADELFELKLGERKSVLATNESKINFYYNPGPRLVEWDVTKGAYRFQVGGFECWRALGLADEAGAQQWDKGTESINLSNYSKDPMHSVLVMLAARINVGVFPKATFQYAFLTDCLNFGTSGVGGPILLYNDDTKETTQLQTDNLLFRSGVVVNRSGNSNRKEVVRVGWRNKEVVEVRGSGGANANVPVTQERFLEGLEGKVQVVHTKEDEVTVTATQGSYIIRPDFLDNVTVELAEGQSVTFLTSQKGKVFTLKSASNASGTPQVRLGNGPSTPVNEITFVSGGPGGAGGTGGTLIFTEGAGANGERLGRAPATPNTPTGFGSGGGAPIVTSDPRVTQLPVSPIQ